MSEPKTLPEFNQLPSEQALALLSQCCTSVRWQHEMIKARPFTSLAELLDCADYSWHLCQQPDYLEAFAGHPEIGDINSLQAKYQKNKKLSMAEQKGIETAEKEVLEQLAQGNQIYKEKFGFIFIVFAQGKQANQMLELLERRLNNSRDKELVIAAAEQHKITRQRLTNFIKSE